MSIRYPDLNEPVRTPIGSFPVVVLNADIESVECPRCFAVVRKNRAKAHANWHEPKETR